MFIEHVYPRMKRGAAEAAKIKNPFVSRDLRATVLFSIWPGKWLTRLATGLQVLMHPVHVQPVSETCIIRGLRTHSCIYRAPKLPTFFPRSFLHTRTATSRAADNNKYIPWDAGEFETTTPFCSLENTFFFPPPKRTFARRWFEKETYINTLDVGSCAPSNFAVCRLIAMSFILII